MEVGKRAWRVQWAHLLPLALILAIPALSLILSVPKVEWVPLCLFHWVTGWDCPGCGLTRAFISLFHGEIRASVTYNALAPVLILLLGLYFIYHLERLLGRPFRWQGTSLGRRWISVSFLVLFFGQWIWKLVHRWVLS